jgi:hypothetical protein
MKGKRLLYPFSEGLRILGGESSLLIEMNPQIAVGTTLVCSHPIINATVSAIGFAKTGTAIGPLTGAAYANATAAWVGLGSMKVGMFMMGGFPVLGALLILDGISGRDHGSPMIDWYEEAWRQYEAQWELEELKKTVQIDRDHPLRATHQPASLAQLDNQYRALEVEHELYLMRKEMGISDRSAAQTKRSTPRTLTALDYESFSRMHLPNVGLQVKITATGTIGVIVSEFLHTKWNTHRLEIKPIHSSRTTYVSFSEVSLVTALE